MAARDTAVARAFRAAGFALARQKKHAIYQCPCGHTKVTVAKSSHGGKGDKNAFAQLARTLRACAALRETA